MPVPKRKHGRASTATRRAQHKLEAPSTSACPQCHQPKRPHHVCPECGYYDGREVVETE